MSNIYQSSKIYPYVYIGVHRQTNKFYIGSRTSKRMKLPPEQDILTYKTSSKYVKPIFNEFDWKIIAIFFDKNSALEFENKLINENWADPKILNRHRIKNGKMLFCDYDKRTPEQRKEHALKIANKTKQFFKTCGEDFKENRKLKISKKSKETWKNHPDEIRQQRLKRMSETQIGKKKPLVSKSQIGKKHIANPTTGQRRQVFKDEAKRLVKTGEWIYLAMCKPIPNLG
jgi:hypothetical protein